MDSRDGRAGLVGDERNWQRVCIACVATTTRSSSTGPSLSSGPNSRRQTKTRSRLRNCFRIRLAFVLWINALMCSITTAVIRALETQAPLWPPGTGHGYHARTFGFLLDELIRRITGKTLSEYWQENFARPLQLDFWIGLPEEQNSRVATIYAAKSGKPPEPAAILSLISLRPVQFARKTFTSPYGLHVISKMNDPHIRAQPIVSFGGIGSASALAKFYSMLANGGELNGQTFFPPKTIEWMTTTLSDGVDRVFQIPTAFSAGFMKDSRDAARRMFGPAATSFGHPGAGGSHAFADPENKIAFALRDEPNGTIASA